MDRLPKACTCLGRGECRVCRSVQWAISSNILDKDDPTRLHRPRVKPLDKDDIGGFRSKGRSNSARAKRKAAASRAANAKARTVAALARFRQEREHAARLKGTPFEGAKERFARYLREQFETGKIVIAPAAEYGFGSPVVQEIERLARKK